jgi:DNA repair protein RecO (recombination protein O)
MSAKQRVDGALAFLLHTHPYSESSLILEIFARQQGRMALLARGARRPRSALRGVLLGFAPLELAWFGAGEVKTLAKAEWLGGLPMLSGHNLLLGYYLNELLIALLPREDPHPELFDAYVEAVSALSRGEGDTIQLRRFEHRLLRELGYDHALHLRADKGGAVSAEERYVVLAGQGPTPVDDLDLREDTLPSIVCGQTLLDMAAGNYSHPRTRTESKTVMRQLIAHYLGARPLHSRRIFAEVHFGAHRLPAQELCPS